jgi:hypothetical protein
MTVAPGPCPRNPVTPTAKGSNPRLARRALAAADTTPRPRTRTPDGPADPVDPAADAPPPPGMLTP